MTIELTPREAAATAFIITAALEDEEPSDVRAALIRSRDKLRKALAKDAAPVAPTTTD